jgi:hypothetical protein
VPIGTFFLLLDDEMQEIPAEDEIHSNTPTLPKSDKMRVKKVKK